MTILRGEAAALQTLQTGDSALKFLSKGKSLKVAMRKDILDNVTPVKVTNVYPSIPTNLYDPNNLYAKARELVQAEEKAVVDSGTATEEELKNAKDKSYNFAPKDIYLFHFIDLADGSDIVIQSPKGKDGNKLQGLINQIKNYVEDAEDTIFTITGQGGNTYVLNPVLPKKVTAEDQAMLEKVVANPKPVEEIYNVLDNAVAKHDDAFQAKSLTAQGIDVTKLGVDAPVETAPNDERFASSGQPIDVGDDDLPF